MNELFCDPGKRSTSVFINCPFDDSYLDRFYTLVFATVASGFCPRCALDSDSTSKSRMERIVDGIHNSLFSIHDLARCHGEGSNNYARFNMPFELGISVGHQSLHKIMKLEEQHDWLFLVPEGKSKDRFISDLKGHEPKEYDESNPKSLMSATLSWLVTRNINPKGFQPSEIRPDIIMEALPMFLERNTKLIEQRYGAANVPWGETLNAAKNVLSSL